MGPMRSCIQPSTFRSARVRIITVNMTTPMTAAIWANDTASRKLSSVTRTLLLRSEHCQALTIDTDVVLNAGTFVTGSTVQSNSNEERCAKGSGNHTVPAGTPSTSLTRV